MSFIERVITIINPLVKAGLRSPLHRLLLSRRIMLITVTGRKSGRVLNHPGQLHPPGQRRDLLHRPLRAVVAQPEHRAGSHAAPARAGLSRPAEVVGGRGRRSPPDWGRFLKALPGDAPVYGVTFDAQGEPTRSRSARGRV
jgi:hypothetical protein